MATCGIQDQIKGKIARYTKAIDSKNGFTGQQKKVMAAVRKLLEAGKVSKAAELEAKSGIAGMVDSFNEIKALDNELRKPKAQVIEEKLAKAAEVSVNGTEKVVNELFEVADEIYSITDDADSIVDVFNTLKVMGDTKLSDAHEEKLMESIDELSKYMKQLEGLKIGVSTGTQTEGSYSEGEIGLTIRKTGVLNGLNENPAELMVHEMYHALTEAGINTREGFQTVSKLDQIMNKMEEEIDPSELIDERFEGTEEEQLAAAEELHTYIFSSPSEFVAHAKSNAKLMELLEDKRMTKKRDSKGTVLSEVWDWIDKLIAKLLGNVDTTGKLGVGANIRELISKLATVSNSSKNEIKKSLWEKAILDPMDSVNKAVLGVAEKGNELVKAQYDKRMAIKYENVEGIIAEMRAGLKSPKYKKMNSMQRLAAVMKHYMQLKKLAKYDAEKLDGRLGVRAEVLVDGMESLHVELKVLEDKLTKSGIIQTKFMNENGLVVDVLTDMLGGKKAMKKYEKLGLEKSYLIDSARSKEVAGFSRVYEKLIKGKLKDSDRVAITNAVLKTDVTDLGLGLTEEMFQEEWVAEKIAGIHKELAGLMGKEQLNYTKFQAKALAGKMVRRQIQYGQVSSVNDIVTMRLVHKAPKKVDTELVRELVNKLKSYEALATLDADTKNTMETLIKYEEVDFDGLMKHVKKYKDGLGGKGAGYVVEKFNKNTVTKLAKVDVATKRKLAKLGFKLYRTLEMEHLGVEDGELGIYVMPEGMVLDKVQGAASITGSNLRGTDMLSLLQTEKDADIEESSEVQAKLLNVMEDKRHQDEVKKQLAGTAELVEMDNIMLPVMADGGIQYKIELDDKAVKDIFDNDENFVDVLARSKSRENDIVRTLEVNRKLADMLHDDYLDEYTTLMVKRNKTKADRDRLEKKYVAINNTNDPEIAEMWRLLPSETKDYFNKKFGGDVIVNRDVLNLAFGYRKATLTNLKLPAMLGGADVFGSYTSKKIVRSTEKMWQNVIAMEKVQIVMKIPQVFYSNVVSNTILATGQYGVPVKYFAQKTHEAIMAMETYQREEAELIEEKANKEAGLVHSTAKIARLELSMARNPVNTMVKAGLFQTIVEDVDTAAFKSSNGLSAAITAKADELLGKEASSLAQQLLVTENSKLFKVLTKATQYSDFTARYAVHQWNMQKEMNEYESLILVNDMFINYNKPNSKTLQYLNDSGQLMFTKFLLRIQPVIGVLVKKKPANAFMTIMGQYLTFDIEDINDSSLWETELGYKVHMNPFSHIIGAFTPGPVNLLGL